jgi:hypothetical protein
MRADGFAYLLHQYFIRQRRRGSFRGATMNQDTHLIVY